MTERSRTTFGRNVKIEQIKKQIGIKELARAANVSPSMISHVINGTKKPPFDVACAIADRLGVTVDELISEEVR